MHEMVNWPSTEHMEPSLDPPPPKPPTTSSFKWHFNQRRPFCSNNYLNVFANVNLIRRFSKVHFNLYEIDVSANSVSTQWRHGNLLVHSWMNNITYVKRVACEGTKNRVVTNDMWDVGEIHSNVLTLLFVFKIRKQEAQVQLGNNESIVICISLYNLVEKVTIWDKIWILILTNTELYLLVKVKY